MRFQFGAVEERDSQHGMMKHFPDRDKWGTQQ